MPALTEDAVRHALRQVRYPGFSRDIVSFGLVKAITVSPDGVVSVEIALMAKDPAVPAQIETEIKQAVAELPGVTGTIVHLHARQPSPPATAGDTPPGIPGVGKIIAVASGKGGVGKSTVAANLAVALAAQGLAVGLCDCDLYGPSIALMFGANEQPLADEHDRIVPVERHGIKLMSMGLLLSDDSPVIVRGPLATRFTQQLLRQVDWGKLDVLILDLPPGTGDIQLTIVQTVALDGAIIVTTPQEVALIDARKAATMFDKVNVPVLGLIENMSWFECPSDGQRYHLFGREGGVREARRIGVPLLGQIPLTVETREQADEGRPVALLPPSGNQASAAFHQVARLMAAQLGRLAPDHPAPLKQ